MMKAKRAAGTATTVDEYIAAAPKPAQAMLRQLRQLVLATVPKAEERISYRIPYYTHHGRLTYFAAFSKHVSLYVMNRDKAAFAKQTEPWRTSPSTMQFPFGTKLPVALLKRMIRARRLELEAAAQGKPARGPRSARAHLPARKSAQAR